MATPEVSILRLPDTLTDPRGVPGRRLRIRTRLDGRASARVDLPAVERDAEATGYTFVKEGTYVGRMDTTFLGSGRRVNVLRILDVPVERRDGSVELNDRHLIHVANQPHELEGCIAPGLDVSSAGVAQSRRGMALLFDALGGFERGRDVVVVVEREAQGEG